MTNFRQIFISIFGFSMGLFVVGTWLIFINAPIPEAQASGSELLSKKCQPATWLGQGPSVSHNKFTATKTIACDIVLDRRLGNPESLKALVLHDLQTEAHPLVSGVQDIAVVNGEGKSSMIELVHERVIAGSPVLVQDEAVITADAGHFHIVTTSENILRGNFFATQLKSQNREVTVRRLPVTATQEDCGHFQVTVTMSIEFDKTLKTAPPAIFASDAESIATKAFNQTVANTLEELGRRL